MGGCRTHRGGWQRRIMHTPETIHFHTFSNFFAHTFSGHRETSTRPRRVDFLKEAILEGLPETFTRTICLKLDFLLSGSRVISTRQEAQSFVDLLILVLTLSYFSFFFDFIFAHVFFPACSCLFSYLFILVHTFPYFPISRVSYVFILFPNSGKSTIK